MKWGRTLEVSSVTKRLKAKCFTQLFTNQLEHPIEYAFACDLMSDVLTFVNQEILLITGLSQLQSLRTAEMLDIKYILFCYSEATKCCDVRFSSKKSYDFTWDELHDV